MMHRCILLHLVCILIFILHVNADVCSSYVNCSSCVTNGLCGYCNSPDGTGDACYNVATTPSTTCTDSGGNWLYSLSACTAPSNCNVYSDCLSCTNAVAPSYTTLGCIWCNSQQKCIANQFQVYKQCGDLRGNGSCPFLYSYAPNTPVTNTMQFALAMLPTICFGAIISCVIAALRVCSSPSSGTYASSPVSSSSSVRLFICQLLVACCILPALAVEGWSRLRKSGPGNHVYFGLVGSESYGANYRTYDCNGLSGDDLMYCHAIVTSAAIVLIMGLCAIICAVVLLVASYFVIDRNTAYKPWFFTVHHCMTTLCISSVLLWCLSAHLLIRDSSYVPQSTGASNTFELWSSWGLMLCAACVAGLGYHAALKGYRHARSLAFNNERPVRVERTSPVTLPVHIQEASAKVKRQPSRITFHHKHDDVEMNRMASASASAPSQNDAPPPPYAPAAYDGPVVPEYSLPPLPDQQQQAPPPPLYQN